MERFRTLASGKAIVIGDFNGRHESWFSASNARGRKLYEWAETRRWLVKAPAQSTCLNSSGTQSTIDFAMARDGAVRRVTARFAWREAFAGSDHAPVTLEW